MLPFILQLAAFKAVLAVPLEGAASSSSSPLNVHFNVEEGAVDAVPLDKQVMSLSIEYAVSPTSNRNFY